MSSESLARAWEGEAEAWIRFAREHDDFFWRFGLAHLLEMLPPPGRLAVDAGCGEGRLTRILRDRGYRVAGFDASPTLVRAAHAHPDAAPSAVADVAALPVKRRAADLVVSYMVLQDVDDLGAVLSEAARVLGGGGRLCAAIVHPVNSSGEFTGDANEFALRHSYFATRRFADVVDRDGVRMTFHGEHRPLETYFRAFEDAGFLIESVREPVPGADILGARPSAAGYARVPWAIFLRGIRALWAGSRER